MLCSLSETALVPTAENMRSRQLSFVPRLMLNVYGWSPGTKGRVLTLMDCLILRTDDLFWSVFITSCIWSVFYSYFKKKGVGGLYLSYFLPMILCIGMKKTWTIIIGKKLILCNLRWLLQGKYYCINVHPFKLLELRSLPYRLTTVQQVYQI